MESEEQWSRRDFTQIKPRRPEGPAEEEWEEVEAPFSFLWSSSSAGAGEVEEEAGGENGNEQEEFEFSSGMSTAKAPTVVERSGISPADELFFKGQLLPLHLPPRIQMVKKLSLEKQQQQQQQQEEVPAATTSQFRNAQRNEEIIARVNALMQTRFTSLFQPKYSKFCISASSSENVDVVPTIPARLGNSWWDPRSENSSSSTDRDSSDSSSRDSSGSSQDCFDGSTDGRGTSFLHNREVFSTHSAYPGERFSAKLRPPFKWKVLFGAKKSTASRSPYDISAEPKTQSMETAPPEFFSVSPVGTDRYFSDCSGELTPSGNLHLSSRTFGHDQPRGARGYLQRYMKALNPSRSSKSDDGAPTKHSSPAIATSRSFPPFSQSFRISPKEISLKMNKSRPPPASSGPPRRVSTSSASSELHSAIQGAIAHCKESQKQSQRQDAEQQVQSSNFVDGHLQKVVAPVN